MALLASFLFSQCSGAVQKEQTSDRAKIPVILDTDANCEIDDQHAMAYLLFSGATFDVKGITVNATKRGGPIEKHYAEAQRVAKLCGVDGKIPLLMGADTSFEAIRAHLSSPDFEGAEAVRFIVEQAKAFTGERLVLLAIGKLTNLALAFELEPAIIDKVRIVWLGTNYPRGGETNLVADPEAMNYILKLQVPLDVVTVDFKGPSGTYAVRVTQAEINEKMPGLGPRVDPPVGGRHGGAFQTFGDYSVNLFDHVNYKSGPRSRAIFDVVAVAILKNAGWGEVNTLPCPLYRVEDDTWVEQPNNPREIRMWKNFHAERIKADFYHTLEHFQVN